MSEYARYPEYKDSGVPWLGDIPSHWQSKRLKFLGEIVLGLTYSPEDITTDTENSTLILRSSNVQNGKLAFDDNVFVTKNIPKKMITTENDILICSRNGSRALIGKCALIEGHALNQAFGAFMTVYRSPYRKFIYYMLNSEIFKSQLGTFLTSTINQLTTQVLGNFEISLPPDDEQKAINSFLDRELGKIDALIDKQQLLLDKLAEQRSAVITQAVTKGLNPNAEMKDSGVAWLGDVPSHWQVTPFKLMMDSLIDYRGKTPEKTSDGVFLITARNIKKGVIDYTLSQEFISEDSYDEVMRRGLPKLGHVLMTTEAPLGEVAQIDRIDVALAQRVLKFDGKKEKLDNSFLKNFILSKAFQTSLYKFATGSTALGIKSERLTYLKLLIPPMDEQIQIVEFIDQETQKIDQMTETVNRAIERLKEYRSTLITQAVTGKIKVF